MAKKETAFPKDLGEVAKLLIDFVLNESDEMNREATVHNYLKKVYRSGRSRGEREATPQHLKK